MARLRRVCPPGIPQHIVQRGNNRQVCFASDKDISGYVHWLRESSHKHRVAIHARVLMTNHVHILATPHGPGSISRMMQWIGRHYVRYFSQTHLRSGALWEGRFRSCVVDADGYLPACHRYIEMNPVRANMVSAPEHYRCQVINVTPPANLPVSGHCMPLSAPGKHQEGTPARLPGPVSHACRGYHAGRAQVIDPAGADAGR
jgi:REP element-mobilizing transposase RayT